MKDRRVKLSREQVEEIIQLYQNGDIQQLQLALKFGVSQSRINQLIKKHLG